MDRILRRSCDIVGGQSQRVKKGAVEKSGVNTPIAHSPSETSKMDIIILKSYDHLLA
jgi:hypothetical protein